MSHTCLTVSYCYIGHHAWYLLCRHNKYTIQHLFSQADKFKRNIMYLKVSTDVKILNFCKEKLGEGMKLLIMKLLYYLQACIWIFTVGNQKVLNLDSYCYEDKIHVRRVACDGIPCLFAAF